MEKHFCCFGRVFLFRFSSQNLPRASREPPKTLPRASQSLPRASRGWRVPKAPKNLPKDPKRHPKRLSQYISRQICVQLSLAPRDLRAPENAELPWSQSQNEVKRRWDHRKTALRTSDSARKNCLFNIKEIRVPTARLKFKKIIRKNSRRKFASAQP